MKPEAEGGEFALSRADKRGLRSRWGWHMEQARVSPSLFEICLDTFHTVLLSQPSVYFEINEQKSSCKAY